MSTCSARRAGGSVNEMVSPLDSWTVPIGNMTSVKIDVLPAAAVSQPLPNVQQRVVYNHVQQNMIVKDAAPLYSRPHPKPPIRPPPVIPAPSRGSGRGRGRGRGQSHSIRQRTSDEPKISLESLLKSGQPVSRNTQTDNNLLCRIPAGTLESARVSQWGSTVTSGPPAASQPPPYGGASSTTKQVLPPAHPSVHPPSHPSVHPPARLPGYSGDHAPAVHPPPYHAIQTTHNAPRRQSSTEEILEWVAVDEAVSLYTNSGLVIPFDDFIVEREAERAKNLKKFQYLSLFNSPKPKVRPRRLETLLEKPKEKSPNNILKVFDDIPLATITEHPPVSQDNQSIITGIQCSTTNIGSSTPASSTTDAYSPLETPPLAANSTTSSKPIAPVSSSSNLHCLGVQSQYSPSVQSRSSLSVVQSLPSPSVVQSLPSPSVVQSPPSSTVVQSHPSPTAVLSLPTPSVVLSSEKPPEKTILPVAIWVASPDVKPNHVIELSSDDEESPITILHHGISTIPLERTSKITEDNIKDDKKDVDDILAKSGNVKVFDGKEYPVIDSNDIILPIPPRVSPSTSPNNALLLNSIPQNKTRVAPNRDNKNVQNTDGELIKKSKSPPLSNAGETVIKNRKTAKLVNSQVVPSEDVTLTGLPITADVSSETNVVTNPQAEGTYKNTVQNKLIFLFGEDPNAMDRNDEPKKRKKNKHKDSKRKRPKPAADEDPCLEAPCTSKIIIPVYNPDQLGGADLESPGSSAQNNIRQLSSRPAATSEKCLLLSAKMTSRPTKTVQEFDMFASVDAERIKKARLLKLEKRRKSLELRHRKREEQLKLNCVVKMQRIKLFDDMAKNNIRSVPLDLALKSVNSPNHRLSLPEVTTTRTGPSPGLDTVPSGNEFPSLRKDNLNQPNTPSDHCTPQLEKPLNNSPVRIPNGTMPPHKVTRVQLIEVNTNIKLQRKKRSKGIEEKSSLVSDKSLPKGIDSNSKIPEEVSAVIVNSPDALINKTKITRVKLLEVNTNNVNYKKIKIPNRVNSVSKSSNISESMEVDVDKKSDTASVVVSNQTVPDLGFNKHISSNKKQKLINEDAERRSEDGEGSVCVLSSPRTLFSEPDADLLAVDPEPERRWNLSTYMGDHIGGSQPRIINNAKTISEDVIDPSTSFGTSPVTGDTRTPSMPPMPVHKETTRGSITEQVNRENVSEKLTPTSNVGPSVQVPISFNCNAVEKSQPDKPEYSSQLMTLKNSNKVAVSLSSNASSDTSGKEIPQEISNTILPSKVSPSSNVNMRPSIRPAIVARHSGLPIVTPTASVRTGRMPSLSLKSAPRRSVPPIDATDLESPSVPSNTVSQKDPLAAASETSCENTEECTRDPADVRLRNTTYCGMSREMLQKRRPSTDATSAFLRNRQSFLKPDFKDSPPSNNSSASANDHNSKSTSESIAVVSHTSSHQVETMKTSINPSNPSAVVSNMGTSVEQVSVEMISAIPLPDKPPP